MSQKELSKLRIRVSQKIETNFENIGLTEGGLISGGQLIIPVISKLRQEIIISKQK